MNTRTVRLATQPQLDYVRKLRAEIFDIHRELKVIAGDTTTVEALDDAARAMTVHTNDVRDVRHASWLIDHGKEAVRRLRADLDAARATVAEINAIVDDGNAVTAAAPVNAPAEAPFDPHSLEIGIYRVGDEIFRVRPNKGGTRKYAERLVHTVGDAKRLTAAGEKIKMTYEYARGAIYRIRHENRVTGAEAEELSIVFTQCIAGCGHTLRAADSVERGIGPVCRKKWGL
jgi:hypothetical protein